MKPECERTLYGGRFGCLFWLWESPFMYGGIAWARSPFAEQGFFYSMILWHSRYITFRDLAVMVAEDHD